MKDRNELIKNFVKASRMMGRGMHWQMHTHKPGTSLHHGQGRLLAVLSKVGPIRQNELVERMDIRPSSLSELLGKLEERELVERKEDESDRRVMVVSITDKGKEIAEGQIGAREELSETMFGALSEDEQEQLNSMLVKLIEAWDEEFDEADFAHAHAARAGMHGGHHGRPGHHGGHHGHHGRAEARGDRTRDRRHKFCPYGGDRRRERMDLRFGR